MGNTNLTQEQQEARDELLSKLRLVAEGGNQYQREGTDSSGPACRMAGRCASASYSLECGRGCQRTRPEELN